MLKSLDIGHLPFTREPVWRNRIGRDLAAIRHPDHLRIVEIHLASSSSIPVVKPDTAEATCGAVVRYRHLSLVLRPGGRCRGVADNLYIADIRIRTQEILGRAKEDAEI